MRARSILAPIGENCQVLDREHVAGLYCDEGLTSLGQSAIHKEVAWIRPRRAAMATTFQDRFTLRPADSDALSVESPPNSSSQTVEGLTIAQARELLDWLEGHNIRTSDVRLDDSGRMTVAWIS
jgi:hypothetical protein